MSKTFELTKQLTHCAFIMDGNGRWAKAKNLPRHLGHKEGCNRILDICKACSKFGIRIASFYAFSTENWNRPKDEIDHLFNYLEMFFLSEKNNLIKNKIRVIISGDTSRLPEKTQAILKEIIEITKDFEDFVMNICLNYGGQDEIVKATREIAIEYKNGSLNLDDITKELFEKHLYTKGLPNVDLLIRTSGEQRTSNYLPWQLAYAEFVFTNTYWPDFKEDKFIECLEEYCSRNRRFGGLKNE